MYNIAVKAKVTSGFQPSKVQAKPDNHTLRKCDETIVDSTGNIKLVVWEDDIRQKLNLTNNTFSQN